MYVQTNAYHTTHKKDEIQKIHKVNPDFKTQWAGSANPSFRTQWAESVLHTLCERESRKSYRELAIYISLTRSWILSSIKLLKQFCSFICCGERGDRENWMRKAAVIGTGLISWCLCGYPKKLNNFTRMSVCTFDKLLERLQSRLTNQDTQMRNSVSPEELVPLKYVAMLI